MKVWGPFKEQLGNWLAQKYWICLHQSQERIAPSLFPCCNISIFFLTFSLILLNLEIVFKSSYCGDFKKQNENDFVFWDFSKVGLGEGGKNIDQRVCMNWDIAFLIFFRMANHGQDAFKSIKSTWKTTRRISVLQDLSWILHQT